MDSVSPFASQSVRSPAVFGIAHVDILRCSGHYVPHFLLDVHRAGGIVHLQAQFRVGGLQDFLGLGQGACGFRVQVSFMQVGVKHPSREVVRPCVHQAHAYRAVHAADIHEARPFHGLSRPSRSLGAGGISG